MLVVMPLKRKLAFEASFTAINITLKDLLLDPLSSDVLFAHVILELISIF